MEENITKEIQGKIEKMLHELLGLKPGITGSNYKLEFTKAVSKPNYEAITLTIPSYKLLNRKDFMCKDIVFTFVDSNLEKFLTNCPIMDITFTFNNPYFSDERCYKYIKRAKCKLQNSSAFIDATNYKFWISCPCYNEKLTWDTKCWSKIFNILKEYLERVEDNLNKYDDYDEFYLNNINNR